MLNQSTMLPSSPALEESSHRERHCACLGTAVVRWKRRYGTVRLELPPERS